MYIVIRVWDFLDSHATTMDANQNYGGCRLQFRRLLSLCTLEIFSPMPRHIVSCPSCPMSSVVVFYPCHRVDRICPRHRPGVYILSFQLDKTFSWIADECFDGLAISLCVL